MKTESTIYWTVICVLWYYHWRGDRCRDSFSDLSGRDCFAADFDGIAAYIAKK